MLPELYQHLKTTVLKFGKSLAELLPNYFAAFCGFSAKCLISLDKRDNLRYNNIA